MDGDDNDSIIKEAGDVLRGDGPTDITHQEHGADFQLPLPPLSDSDGEFLRAVAARAEARRSHDAQKPPLLRRLIAAYTDEAAARGMSHGLAPVYQGYLLKMSDGVSVDELLDGGGQEGVEAKRKEKL